MLHETLSPPSVGPNSGPAQGNDDGISREGILACLRDLIEASLVTPGVPRNDLTRALHLPATLTELADCDIGAAGLGLDSLDRMAAASAVGRFFDLGATGVDDYLMHADRLADWADLVCHHYSAVGGEAQITFMTSGSLGDPVACTHFLRDLRDEVTQLAPVIGATAPYRIVALVPAHHMYGFLWTVLMATVTGCRIVAAARCPASRMERLIEPGDLVVATPLTWQSFVDHQVKLPANVSGLVSAAAMPPKLWEDLAKLGLASLVELYGATETGGIGWRATADVPLQLMPHLERSGDGLRYRSQNRAVSVQDKLVWHADRAFDLGGRKDRAVQIGGVNVSLTHVRETILSAPAIADAAVREDGGRLKAFVVPETLIPGPEIDAFLGELSSWLAHRLEAAARPVHLTIGERLPRNAMGKLMDWDITPDAENGR